MLLTNQDKSTGSISFEHVSESDLKKPIVKLMNNSELTKSNASYKSNTSNSQQFNPKTIIIKFNESFQISNSNIQNNSEDEKNKLKEKIESLTKEVKELKKYKQYFSIASKLIKGFYSFYNLHKNDDISTYHERNQNSTYQNDSLNLSLERHQSLNEIYNTEIKEQNNSNLRRFNLNQSNNSPEPTFNKSKSQAINYSNKLEFINSQIKNNNIKTDHKSINIEEENKKKIKNKFASSVAIMNFRKKYNIPENITNDEIKSEIIRNKYDHEKAKEILFEKINANQK